MSDYTPEQVETRAALYDEINVPETRAMLRAYADLLERRAEGVTDEVCRQVLAKLPLYAADTPIDMMRAALTAVWPVAAEPAQPADGASSTSKPPQLGGCCCGEPCTLGVVHRTDGPCFAYTQPADSGRVDADHARDLRHLIYLDTQFNWRGETDLKLPEMQALEARGWITEGAENGEFEITDAGREAIAAALAAQGQGTTCSLNEALNVIETWADHGNQLHGDDVPRLRSAVDRIAPASPAGVPEGWKLAMYVLQSDLYAELPDEELAVCDALTLQNPYIFAAPSSQESQSNG